MSENASALLGLAETQAALILSFSTPKDALRTRASSSSGVLAKAANSQNVWQFYSKNFFGLVGEAAYLGPDAETQSTTTDRSGRKENENVRALIHAFSLWDAAARKVGLDMFNSALPLPQNWISGWKPLHEWTGKKSAQGLGSRFRLRGPATPEDFKELEENGLQMAAEVAGMWKVHDGQECAFPEEEEESDSWTGMFGGYGVYDHYVSTRLLPLKKAVSFTLEMRERLPSLGNKIFFAASNYTKLFLVDVSTGEVFVISPGNRSISFQPAAPSSDSQPRTGLLRWFREYTRRLNADFYPVLPLNPQHGNRSLGLCLCPQAAPEATCCVTRGVEIRASCVYMPEHPQGWTYSISCRLVGTAAERGFEQCQLHTRTWKIQEDGQEAQEVHGEGVIGLFPILVDGGWTLNHESDPHGQYEIQRGFVEGSFRYQSCSGRSRSMRGTFGGLITFVPGTKRKPSGQPFQAHLEPFSTFVPDFIY